MSDGPMGGFQTCQRCWQMFRVPVGVSTLYCGGCLKKIQAERPKPKEITIDSDIF